MGRLGSGNREFNSANARDRCDCGSAGDLDTTMGPCIRAEKLNDSVTNAKKDNPCTTRCKALPYPDFGSSLASLEFGSCALHFRRLYI
jgi:hypothetical protein